MRTPLPRPAGWAALLLTSTLVAGCGRPQPQPKLPKNEGPPDWITEVVQHPDRFAALMKATGKAGWVAFHSNDLRKADAAFSGSDPVTKRSRARVQWELALLYGDLARTSDYVHMAFFSSWSARELPLTPGIKTLSAQWRACGGLDDMGVEDTSKLPEIFKTDVALPDAVAKEAPLHEHAREGDFAGLYAAAAQPWIVEPAKGFTHFFYDPCVFRTLHDGWFAQAEQTTGGKDWQSVARVWGKGAGLEGRLFAPWLTTGDLESEIAHRKYPGTLGASQPSLVYFGVSTEMSVQDDVEVAREDVRSLDAAIALRQRALLADGNSDGDALLTDLGLQHRFRQEWIAARARKALYEGRPHQAMAYLELARDVSTRAVGPANTPSVLALYAEAEVRLGRTREALDVLEILQQALPEVTGLKELTGDLAVLQGLDRQGVSKEN